MLFRCLHVQHEIESAKKKAYQLQVLRREEYEKARSASGRSEEEQSGGGRQRDKRRKLEEEALLKVGLHQWRLLGLHTDTHCLLRKLAPVLFSVIPYGL